ncbi:MAG: glycosyltransferase family 2 protein, partial [Sphingobacteriales bacterium]
MQLSVIIVNYNVKYFLEQCLCSVQKACIGIDTEVIVIDNNSTDGSRQWLEEKFARVKFIWQTNNDGFGKANNKALKMAKGDFILFLNPDTIIAEDSLRLCIDKMNADASIGALGVRMIDGSGRFLKESKRGFPTAAASFYKMSGLTALFPSSRSIAHYYAGHLTENKTHEVDVLAGAFMMLSRKAVEETQGFDEDFFMYGEDVDLSYRIQKAGLKNIYFPETTIIHFKGESTQKFSASYNKHFYGAMRLFVKKHFAQKKTMLFFTGIAINAGKTMGAFKSIFSKTNEVDQKRMNTAVVARQATFTQSLHLLKHAVPPLAVIGRISIDNADEETSLGKINDIKLLIAKHKIDQLLFCGGDQSFKTIIAQVQ